MTSEEIGTSGNGPGRGHEWARTVSAVVVALAAIAVALGVLTEADEATKQTDLLQQQTVLLQEDADRWEPLFDE